MRPEPMIVNPVTLTGRLIVLEPLSMDHLEDLAIAARFDEIWSYLDEDTPRDKNPVKGLIEEALEEQSLGQRLPFAIRELNSGTVVGSVSFIDIQRQHHGLEIGWAWLTPPKWRSGLIREASYLLMEHAFETMKAIRVVFKTDLRNERSQRAILGLGAKQEGIFRNHRILRDGHVRTSIYYSVTSEDWPGLALDQPSSDSA
jgi:RimJ/RimL family protein N-acetyltransferase